MANTTYPNYFLSNEIEDQFNSHLDLERFCTVDTSLTGTAGMIRKVNVYSATNSTEKLTKGTGNTLTTEASYVTRNYPIGLAQNRFMYYDEDAMEDPMIPVVGSRHLATDMFNTINAETYAEYMKASRVVVASSFNFDAFADAAAAFGFENLEGTEIFGFVSPDDVAALRKALKDDLKYVEAFVRTGYVGTICGINIYTKKDATPGKIALATNKAVTMFIKKGTEVEQPTRAKDEANTRENWIFTRKYYVVALTNDTQAVVIIKGSAAVSTDNSFNSSKTYYEKDGLSYVKTSKTSGNPATLGLYEITAA